MRIDAHQHFWHYSEAEYGWIGPAMAILKQDRLPHDLAPILQEQGLDATVAVQARQTVEETAWLLALAEQTPFIKGVVGWVDLRSPKLRDQLERFCAFPKFRGVRHVVQDEADDRFMLGEDFCRGIGILADFSLVYDLLIFPKHLPVACELVARFPDQPFVLDLIAKPFIKRGSVTPWGAGIRRLAAFPNVSCKVSGMVTEANWVQWRNSDFVPYLDIVFEAFSPERIMFGSDWPVCTVTGNYSAVADIVSDYVSQLSEYEQADVWGGTAVRVYGIG
ncbi:amidohydrolase family protein [Chloroflexota bacterium]